MWPDLNLDQTRAVCTSIRNMRKLSHRQDALLNLRKELKIIISGATVGIGMKSSVQETGLEVLQEFVKVYVEINNLSRRDINAKAGVFFSLPATRAEVAQWQNIKAKYTAAPYYFVLYPSCPNGDQSTDLDDQLRPTTPWPSLSTGKMYILEPYWSDIVKVLATEQMCPISHHQGVVIKIGQPPQYYFKNSQIELFGTSDLEMCPLVDLRPCRSLLCPGAHVDRVRKCSRCGLAAYCSKDCQKAHWPLHKPHCRADSAPHS